MKYEKNRWMLGRGTTRPVELRHVASCAFSKGQLRKICGRSSCFYGGSSIKQLVVIHKLFLPQHADVGSRTVYSRCTVYVLLKHLTQQVAYGLFNDKAPSMITSGMIGKGQNSVL